MQGLFSSNRASLLYKIILLEGPCPTRLLLNHHRLSQETNVTSIHLLAGIAPRIRRIVASRVERQRQTTQTSHQLYDHVTIWWPTEIAEQLVRIRLQMWNNQLTYFYIAAIKLGLEAAESLPAAGSDQPWH